MNTMLDHTTDGESRGEEQRVFYSQLYSLNFWCTKSFFFPLCKFNFGFLYLQLELCGGLTPISERSTRASCDDNDSHTQVSLLAEASDANTNSYISEDSCYATTVCHTTRITISEFTAIYITNNVSCIEKYIFIIGSAFQFEMSCWGTCLNYIQKL